MTNFSLGFVECLWHYAIPQVLLYFINVNEQLLTLALQSVLTLHEIIVVCKM